MRVGTLICRIQGIYIGVGRKAVVFRAEVEWYKSRVFHAGRGITHLDWQRRVNLWYSSSMESAKLLQVCALNYQ